MEEKLYKFWQRANQFIPLSFQPQAITFERIVDFARAVHDYAQAAQDIPVNVRRDIAILEKIIHKADRYHEEYLDDPQFLEPRELKKTQSMLWNSVDAIWYNITQRVEKALGIRHADWVTRATHHPAMRLARILRAQDTGPLAAHWTAVHRADAATEHTLTTTTLYALAKATHDFLHAVLHEHAAPEGEIRDMLHTLQIRIVPRLAVRLTRDEMVALRSQIRHMYNMVGHMLHAR